MEKFSLKRRSKFSIGLRVFLILIFLAFFVNLINRSVVGEHEQERKILENAVSQHITQCYALEGEYPPDLEYLQEHYGLMYNRELFLVDYQFIGGNIRPDITIIERK